MGFIDTAPETNSPVFYNVVHAVGRYCPNVRDDVKLIQYMLLKFYDKATAFGATKPNGKLTVDGCYGGITANWVLKFQLDMSSHFPSEIAVDNRVDRIRNKRNFRGSVTSTIYTLAFLNRNLLKVNPEAYVLLPQVVPLENIMNVPPPSWDVVNEINVDEESGGF